MNRFIILLLAALLPVCESLHAQRRSDYYNSFENVQFDWSYQHFRTVYTRYLRQNLALFQYRDVSSSENVFVINPHDDYTDWLGFYVTTTGRSHYLKEFADYWAEDDNFYARFLSGLGDGKKLYGKVSGYNTIREGFFRDLQTLEVMQFGDAVVHLEKDMLRDCKNLKYVKFGPNIRYYGQDLLLGCNNIEVVEFELDCHTSYPDFSVAIQYIMHIFHTDFQRTGAANYPHLKYIVIPDDGREDTYNYWYGLFATSVCKAVLDGNAKIIRKSEFYAPRVTGVTLNESSIMLLDPGSTYQLTATVNPSGAYDKTVTWSSSNPAVATVSSTGLVTRVSPGTADITATSKEGGFTASCRVTTVMHVTGVSLDKHAVTLAVGESANLSVTVSPANATDKSFTCSSGNPAVADITGTTGQGISVRAYMPGTADITVCTGDGNYCDICTFTVIIPVTGITLSSSGLALVPGSASQLTATVAPSNATDKRVTWSSSNAAVATVSSSGLVTAGSRGTATITATSQQNSGKKATCAVTVQNNDAGLRSLVPSAGSLSPAFNKDILNYNITVPSAVSAITLTATQNDAYATVTGAGAKTVGVGENTFRITVRAESGLEKTYTVGVYRQSGDAALKSVSVRDADNPGDIRNLDPSVLNHTVNVVNDIRSIAFSAEKNDSKALVSDFTGVKALQAGDNRFSITVAAEDRTVQKTYSFNISREPLEIQTLVYKYWYYDDALHYRTREEETNILGGTVGHTYTHVQATITTNSRHTDFTGDLLEQTPLNYGFNSFRQTIDNGYDPSITYYFYFDRELNPNFQLQSLDVPGYQIQPRFDRNTYGYTLSVDKTVDKIRIDAVPISPATVSGHTGEQKLNQGNNVFTFTVTALTGDASTYTLIVKRDLLDTDAALSGLAVNPDAYLSPPFNPEITAYTTEVENYIDEVRIDANPRTPTAKFADTDYDLPGTYHVNVGDNHFNFSIFAENPSYNKIYSLTVTRKDNMTGMQDINSSFCRWLKPAAGGGIEINSPVAEHINIYSTTGRLLYSFDKPAGASTFRPFATSPFHPFAPVLIVKGSSGWVRKVII